MGSGFYNWVYWHFFTITTNYNNSHIEFLNYDSCLTNALKNLLKARMNIKGDPINICHSQGVKVKTGLIYLMLRVSYRVISCLTKTVGGVAST
jgi:hypothetical protein